MRALVSYLAPIVVFASAIVALLGPTREVDTSGSAALTPLGWSTVTLASISFACAIFDVYYRELELSRARAELNRIRSIASSDLRNGISHLLKVLDFSVLVPYLTLSSKKNLSDYVTGPTLSVDLKSDRAINDLGSYFLEPGMTLQAPYAQPIPFGTDIRPVMTIITEESKKARLMIDAAIQKYAARGVTADVFEAGSKLLNAPYLTFMINLGESWDKRSKMEDSSNPRIVNLRMIGSGVSGGNRADYLALIDGLDRFRASLDGEH